MLNFPLWSSYVPTLAIIAI